MIKLKKVSEGKYEVVCGGETLGYLCKLLGNYKFKAPNGKVVTATTLDAAKKLIGIALK